MADQKAVNRHAINDMTNIPGASQDTPQKTIPQKLVEKRDQWAAQQPAVSGELKALFREGLKDLQDAVLHAFPDSQHGVTEPGTPLNPTQQQVTQEQGNFHGYDPAENVRPGPSPEKERGRSR